MNDENTMTTAAPGAEPLLRVDGLRFGYSDRWLIDGLTFAFPPGVVWVQGGNGRGKSTLLKLLAGALAPAGGRIAVQAIDLALQPLDYRRRVFWCGPGPLAFDHLSPWEYFGFLRTLYPALHLPALQAHVEGLGLGPHAGSLLRRLSTGTQRKVWLAAALAAGTPVTLLDEPLNALDAASLQYLQGALAAAATPDRLWIVASHEAFGAASRTASVLDLEAA